jgi:protein O-mannosyl-transferase
LKSILRNTWLSWLLISLLTLLLYSGTVSYGLLHNYDDDEYFNNATISHLNTHNAGEYFSGYYLGMYQPVPVMSFAVLLKVFPGSVPAQRCANILLHCLNTLLVILFIKKLTGNNLAANLTALLFAIHPMHVESVSWIATRSNLIYSLFYMASLIFWVNWRTNRRPQNWILMLFFFILALFSKVTAATLPFLLVLIDGFMKIKPGWRSVFLYVPLFLLSAIFIVVGIRSSTAFGHITELGLQFGVSDRILIILNALWLYLYKAILPINQSVIYLFPWKEGNSLPMNYLFTGIGILVFFSVIFFAWWKNRKNDSGRVILFGFLFFLLTISIVIPLKWSRTIMIAERYTYIPYIGLFMTIFCLLFQKNLIDRRWMRYSAIIVTFLGVLIFSFLTINRNRVWKNPVTLFSDVIQKDRSGAEVSMGYYNRGNEYLRLNELNNAVSDYTASLRIDPRYTEAWYNRGLVNYKLQLLPEAIDDFTHAIALRNNYQTAYLNRGTAFRLRGNYREALEDFNTAISIEPYAPAYFSRGVLYHFNLGDDARACADWNQALSLGFEPARELLDKFCR